MREIKSIVWRKVLYVLLTGISLGVGIYSLIGVWYGLFYDSLILGTATTSLIGWILVSGLSMSKLNKMD